VEQVIQTLVAFVESVEDKDEFGIKL
jgi:hypothetical protein